MNGARELHALIYLFVGRVINTVKHRHLTEFKWIHPLEATYIETILGRVGSPLMVGVDTAFAAKEMFRNPGVELVDSQVPLAFHDAEIVQGD